MDYIKKTKKYKVKKHYLRHFLKAYWFIPSDVLQRGIEANIWDLCTFKAPVLDIGIGNGTLSNFIFKNKGQLAVGIDIEESGLDSAKKTKKYKKVICANAEKMAFKDNSFNTVVSNSTFEHITNDLNAISEVSRVLKKNGLFFVTIPSNYLLQWITDFEKDRNEETFIDKVKKFNNRTNHLHYRSYNEWEKIFIKNNMEVVFCQHFFPKEVALFWYRLFKILTTKLNGRELWSYIGHSRLTKYLPKNLLILLLENFVLKNMYNKAFFTDLKPGAQLFIIAKKK